MSQSKTGGNHDVAQLSEAKRHLLQKYLSGAPRRNAEGPVLIKHAPPPPTVTAKGHLFPRMRALSLDDYRQVVALEAKYGLGFKSYEQWSHIWLSNPAYQELRQNWPLGWVLEVGKNHIVGAHENIPLLYELNGRRIIAAQGRGLVLDLDYRSYSLWLLGAFFEQENADFCLDTSASFEAAQADSELGALRVPVGAWDRDVLWVTNYPSFISEWLQKRLPKRMSLVGKCLCYPLARALFMKDKFTRPALQRQREGFSVTCCSEFDDRFDEFWEHLRSERSDVLLGVRDRATLEWHFAYALLQKRLWVWTLTQGSRLVAYSIFLKMEDPDSAITRVSLIDFQALQRNTSLLQLMLSVALERCKREGIDVLQNSGLSFAASGINEFAPYQRRRSWWTYFYKVRDASLSQKLSNPNVWDPSLYDGDTSIL